jgi:hypothetical protein
MSLIVLRDSPALIHHLKVTPLSSVIRAGLKKLLWHEAHDTVVVAAVDDAPLNAEGQRRHPFGYIHLLIQSWSDLPTRPAKGMRSPMTSSGTATKSMSAMKAKTLITGAKSTALRHSLNKWIYQP